MLVWSFSSKTDFSYVTHRAPPEQATVLDEWAVKHLQEKENRPAAGCNLGEMGLNLYLKKPTINQMYWCDLNIPVSMETEL